MDPEHLVYQNSCQTPKHVRAVCTKAPCGGKTSTSALLCCALLCCCRGAGTDDDVSIQLWGEKVRR
jgi:hypothetical protein